MTEDATGSTETLADVDHTHPHTGETFGGVYRRGPAVADGAGPGVGVDDATPERLGDVDHADATTADNALWARGVRDRDRTDAEASR
ncbi:MAG: hypothetical protein ABEJ81_02970 [Haloferacaceae archaeon]